MNPDEIIGRECRFAVYCPPPEGHSKDLHVVKEILHLRDGTTTTNVQLLFDYKIPYYITKKGYQNHKDKKEWEDLEKLQEYKTTETNKRWDVAKAAGDTNVKGGMRMLCRNPYIYGTDILSTALIKRYYQDAYPTLITPFSECVYDVETDVFDPLGRIIMATVSYKDRVFTAIRKDFLAGRADVTPRLQELLDKYLSRFVNERNIKWETMIVDTEADIVIKCFDKAHEWKPDFMAIWNIDFDIPKTLEALKRANIHPKDVFSDPAVPYKYRFFDYVTGTRVKKTASGETKPLKPSEQWHTVYCPSSFYFVDAMCAYRQVRTGSQEEPSYALDAILNKEFKDDPEVRKLKFKEADGLEKLEWHQFMQTNHPLEYAVYNVFDCVSLEILDEKTMDLRMTMPMMCGCSDFRNFKSQPRRLADELHFFCLKEKKRVIASTSDQMATDMDNDTVGVKNWIITLPAHLVVENGLRVIEENKHMGTNIRAHVADLDVSASYPNGGAVFNISKETTHKEISRIVGVPEHIQRMAGINLSGGATNAVEVATALYSLPTMDVLLEAFIREQTVIENV